MARIDDESLVEYLLKIDEGCATLDLKSRPYRLDNEHYKALFIKDIISMANTPRDDSAYILIGVHRKHDASKELINVTEHPDDAPLQELIGSRVRHVPKFQYRSVQYRGVSLGIFEIFPQRNGPFLAKVPYENKLKEGVTYWRRGSSNSEATPDEIREIIGWMNQGTKNEPSKLSGANNKNWEEFFQSCNNFEKGWIYAFVAGPCPEVKKGQRTSLGLIDWSLCIDFDTETHVTGLFAAIEPELKSSRAVHLATLPAHHNFNLFRGTYWISARGLKDTPSTLVDDNWKAWYRRYSEYIRETAANFAESAAEIPIIFIVFWDDPDYIKTICEAFDSACGDTINFIFATKDVGKLTNLSETFQAKRVAISMSEVCDGIERMVQKRAPSLERKIPTLENGNTPISPEKLHWLEEDLELLHLETGQDSEAICTPRKDFLQGKMISWVEIATHCDVDRDITAALQAKIEGDLEIRAIRRNYFYHWPGSGGTTISRRVIWNLHANYPSVILHRIIPNETIERLRELFDLTRLPLLVLIEGADIVMSSVDQLFNEVLSRQIPMTYFIVLRTFEHAVEEGKSTFLAASLSVPESRLFAQAYAQIQPDRRGPLEMLAKSTNLNLRNPFYFGLTAFGKDFRSLSEYVSRRLSGVSDTHRLMVTIIAMVYHYGQKSVSSQVFARLLSLSPKRIIRLEHVLTEPLKELIIREDEFHWRPTHELIAVEIVESILQGQSLDRRVWSQNLSVWALRLIEVFASTDKLPSEEINDILTRVFILREETESMRMSDFSGARHYSKIIEDIPSNEGKLGVFQKLVEIFPAAPHYWGHLGRFYAFELHRNEEALEALDKAIELDGDNNVLYHIKGMVLRQQVYNAIDVIKLRGLNSPDELESIKTKVDEASVQFEKSRLFSPQREEHAFVSNIQMLIRVVDLGFYVSQKSTREEFLISVDATWYRDLIDAAENLLDDLKKKQEGDSPSSYTIKCQNGLDELYGDYSRMLEGWTALLNRRDIFLPSVRRQIARVYLTRKSRSWDHLDQRELRRIAQLMQENIETDVTDYRSIRYWFQASRRIDGQSVDAGLERLSYWRATDSKALEASYYLYILLVLQVLDGFAPLVQAQDMIRECSRGARELPNRHNNVEWLGKGVGMKRIVNHSNLPKSWEEEFEKANILTLIDGRISKINGPESGEVELRSGLKAFFVPSRGYKGTYLKGRDENKSVRFYLSFAYDGLRAWSVRDA